LGFVVPGWLIPVTTEQGVFALFLGVAMCVTAIPVIAKTLSDMRAMHREVGQLTLAAGLIDDAVGWFLLSVVSALATVGISTGRVSLSVVYLIGFLVAMFVVGRPALRYVLRLADRSAQSGPTIAVVVIAILVGAAATQALGMEAIFGAFIVGVLVGSPGMVNQRKLAPLRMIVLWVLAPLFLATAGLRMDLTSLAHGGTALVALAILAVAVLGKFAGAFLGAKLSRLSNWEGIALGAGMNARGVIEVIIATAGLRLGVLNTATYTSIILVAIVTSLMAPPLLRMALSRINQSEEEHLRYAMHRAWSEDTPAPAPAPAAPPELPAASGQLKSVA
jgi:Kef-type K+ transport system membrane component KefB